MLLPLLEACVYPPSDHKGVLQPHASACGGRSHVFVRLLRLRLQDSPVKPFVKMNSGLKTSLNSIPCLRVYQQIFSPPTSPSFLPPQLFLSQIAVTACTAFMPSANTRITHIATKPSSLATAPILEPCSAMPRSRVPLSTLERVSARPTTRAPPRPQPPPAAARPTKQVPESTKQVPKSVSERAAAVLERVKARSNQLRPTVTEARLARKAILAANEERHAAFRERIRQDELRAAERRRQRELREEERRRRWGE